VPFCLLGHQQCKTIYFFNLIFLHTCPRELNPVGMQSPEFKPRSKKYNFTHLYRLKLIIGSNICVTIIVGREEHNFMLDFRVEQFE